MARVVYLLVALALLGGAVFAFLVAGAVNWLACENQGTPACDRQDLAFGQFILAMIGLVPALLLVVAVAVRKSGLPRWRWPSACRCTSLGLFCSMLPSTDGMT
jgi:hypothetical protein